MGRLKRSKSKKRESLLKKLPSCRRKKRIRSPLPKRTGSVLKSSLRKKLTINRSARRVSLITLKRNRKIHPPLPKPKEYRGRKTLRRRQFHHRKRSHPSCLLLWYRATWLLRSL